MSKSSVQRLTQSKLPNFVNRTVRFVGEVESRSDSSVVLKDLEGSATITHADPGLYTTRYVEVVGLVREDLTIMQQVVTPFGDEFDMETYAKAVGLWHSAKFSSLFV